MLVYLRKAAHTWVVKGLLLLLVASFGIWGISSTIMQSSSDTVISVGSQKVSINDFRLAYQRQLSDLSRRFGTQLSPEQARALGVESQVYQQLAAGAALDQLASDLNLGLSKDRLAQLIGEDPAFRNSSGQFDRQLFSSRLRNAGIREQDYIAERSKVAVRSQIVEATAEGFSAPKILVDSMKRYRQESRSLDYVILTAAQIDPIKAPDDQTLTTWFDSQKTRYRAPEYRSFSYVKLEPSDIADLKSVSDDQVKKEYDANQQKYQLPGSRTIEQLTFQTKELATAAADQLKNGSKSFDQLIADQGKKPADVLLGDFKKDELPDQKVADAAFLLDKDGATSGVVEGAFGPVILRVSKIVPSHQKTLDEVRDAIRKSLADQAAQQNINAIHDQFEDMRNSGTSLEEAARKLNLKFVRVDGIDRQGLNKAGAEVKDIPSQANVLKSVFETDPGTEPLALNIGQIGFLWFDVGTVEPTRERALNEVKDKVVKDWTADQTAKALAAKSEALKARLDKGEKLEDIARELKVTVEQKTNLRRDTDDMVLGANVVTAAFRGPVGTAGAAVGGDATTQILFKVTDVTTQPTTDVLDQQDQQILQLANAAGDDILDQMVTQLQQGYSVTVNQALAQQAMMR